MAHLFADIKLENVLIWAGAEHTSWVTQLLAAVPEAKPLAWGSPPMHSTKAHAEALGVPYGDDLRAMLAEHKPQWLWLCDAPMTEGCDLGVTLKNNGGQTHVIAFHSPVRTAQDLRSMNLEKIHFVPAFSQLPGMMHSDDIKASLGRPLQLSCSHNGSTQYGDLFTRTLMCFNTLLDYAPYPETIAATGIGEENTTSAHILGWSPGLAGMHVHVGHGGAEAHSLICHGEDAHLTASTYNYELWHDNGNLIDASVPQDLNDLPDWITMLGKSIQTIMATPNITHSTSRMTEAFACTHAAFMSLKGGHAVQVEHVLNMMAR